MKSEKELILELKYREKEYCTSKDRSHQLWLEGYMTALNFIKE